MKGTEVCDVKLSGISGAEVQSGGFVVWAPALRGQDLGIRVHALANGH